MRKSGVLKECIFKLSDENLDYLYTRFERNMTGDLSEALDFLSRNHEVDRMLCSAQSANEFYGTLDQIIEFTKKESIKRLTARKPRE